MAHKMNGTVAGLLVEQQVVPGLEGQEGASGAGDNWRRATIGGVSRRIYVQRTASGNSLGQVKINAAADELCAGDFIVLGWVAKTLGAQSTFAPEDVLRIDVWESQGPGGCRSFEGLGPALHCWNRA
jgi:hypothetical protein